MRVSRQRRRQLEAEATRLLRAADRRKRAAAERTPPPKARPLPPAWPDHLRLPDLGWPCSCCGAEGYHAHECRPGHRD